jgi:hypothetical protein
MSKHNQGRPVQMAVQGPIADPRPQAVADLTTRRNAARAQRQPLLNSIATARGSHVVTYITCGRANLGTLIGADVIRVFREIFGGPRKLPKLDLYLVTRGGHTLTPLRLMSLLREVAEEVHILAPYMAHSAGTLISPGISG